MLIETSHVTIQGLRILGMPVVETPQTGQMKRLYAISRLRRDLDDLEIGQCLFVGEDETSPESRRNYRERQRRDCASLHFPGPQDLCRLLDARQDPGTP